MNWSKEFIKPFWRGLGELLIVAWPTTQGTASEWRYQADMSGSLFLGVNLDSNIDKIGKKALLAAEIWHCIFFMLRFSYNLKVRPLNRELGLPCWKLCWPILSFFSFDILLYIYIVNFLFDSLTFNPLLILFPPHNPHANVANLNCLMWSYLLLASTGASVLTRDCSTRMRIICMRPYPYFSRGSVGKV